MNLKEAFRYQSFIESIVSEGCSFLMYENNTMDTKKIHHTSAADPDTPDREEAVDKEYEYKVEDVIAVILGFTKHKELLTIAINKAKASAGIDIDAGVETNRLKRRILNSMKQMMRVKPRTIKVRGTAYKFNAEGSQLPFYYDVETEYTDAFNRNVVKGIMKDLAWDADEVSTKIDSALINTKVDYTPEFDVNMSFEDVMEAYSKAQE